MKIRQYLYLILVTLGFTFITSAVQAQVTLPTVNLGFKTTQNPQEVVNTIKLVIMMTILTLAPAILIIEKLSLDDDSKEKLIKINKALLPNIKEVCKC